MSENVPFGTNTPIMTPVSDQGLALATMIEALRMQTAALERSSAKIDTLSNAVAKVREEIAVMQVRDEQLRTLHATVEKLEAEINNLKIRNAQQDGGMKTAAFLREWGPWIAALVFGVWTWLRG